MLYICVFSDYRGRLEVKLFMKEKEFGELMAQQDASGAKAVRSFFFSFTQNVVRLYFFSCVQAFYYILLRF